MDRDSIILLTFAVYLIVLLGIGIFTWRRTHDLSDYILGGRKLGSLVAALSAGASDMSGWLLLGLPGYAYVAGLEAIWIGLGLLIGIWCNWKLVAARLRRYTELAGNSLTLPDFFEQRFQDNSRLLRIISAFLILFFFLIYTSSGLVAGGKLFASAFDLPYQWAVVTGALAIVMYTFLGGFLAVSLTDVIQALLMVLALAIVPVVALQQSGGLGNTMTELTRTNSSFLNPFTSASGEALSATAVVSMLAWGLGYFGQPHILARFMAMNPGNKVLDLVSYAWAGFGASFGPLVLFSLFWRRTNRTGALAGILCGGLMVIIWKQLSGGILDLYEIVPGFLVSSLAIVLFSLLGLKPSEDQISLFDKATKKDQEALLP